MQISPFHGDSDDTCLLDLVPFLLSLRKVRDVRMVLSCRLLQRQAFFDFAEKIKVDGAASRDRADSPYLTLSRRLAAEGEGGSKAV